MKIEPVLLALAGAGRDHLYDARADLACSAGRCCSSGLIVHYPSGLPSIGDKPLDSLDVIKALAKQQSPLGVAYIPSLVPVYDTGKPDFSKYNISPYLKKRLDNEFGHLRIIKILNNPFSAKT